MTHKSNTHAQSRLLCGVQAEHAAHRTAKANLKAFLLSNEENRKVKAAQKVQQQEEDIAYQKKFAAILDKQAADRWLPACPVSVQMRPLQSSRTEEDAVAC